MTHATTGLSAGILVAIAGAVGGFGHLLLALVLGAIGFAIAGQLSGDVDRRDLVTGRDRG